MSMSELTRNQALCLALIKVSDRMSSEDLAKTQAIEPFFATSFEQFQNAVESFLDRPVAHHEFTYFADDIIKEIYEKTNINTPTIDIIRKYLTDDEKDIIFSKIDA